MATPGEEGPSSQHGGSDADGTSQPAYVYLSALAAQKEREWRTLESHRMEALTVELRNARVALTRASSCL